MTPFWLNYDCPHCAQHSTRRVTRKELPRYQGQTVHIFAHCWNHVDEVGCEKICALKLTWDAPSVSVYTLEDAPPF